MFRQSQGSLTKFRPLAPISLAFSGLFSNFVMAAATSWGSLGLP